MPLAPTPERRPPKFRRMRDARPGQLIEAALAVFVKRGFAATRFVDVAKVAGVSPGTICLYFPTKEALFLGVVKHYLQPSFDDQTAIMAEPGSPRDRLVRVLQAKAEQLLQPEMASLIKLVVSDIGTFPSAGRELFANIINPFIDQFVKLIDEGVACGEFRPVDARIQARLLLDQLAFAALWQTSFSKVDPHPIDPSALMNAHIIAALRGLDRHLIDIDSTNVPSDRTQG